MDKPPRPMTKAEVAALKELLARAADELAAIKDSAPRIARAQDVFGRWGLRMLAILKEMRDERRRTEQA